VIRDLFFLPPKSEDEKEKIINERDKNGTSLQQKMKSENKTPGYEIRHDGGMVIW
jgi:hypothetical protein